MKTGSLNVLVGPTAVGKGTVLGRLRAQYPELRFSISVTTRAPRPGEQEGRDYFFVSDSEFDGLVETDALLEWAVVHGKHRYGTPAKWVQEQRDLGNDVLLELDVEGARQVRERQPDCQIIFLMPPSWEELEQRLVGRGTEDLEERTRRLQTALKEIDAATEFDAIVTNYDVDQTAQELAHLMDLN